MCVCVEVPEFEMATPPIAALAALMAPVDVSVPACNVSVIETEPDEIELIPEMAPEGVNEGARASQKNTNANRSWKWTLPRSKHNHHSSHQSTSMCQQREN